MKNSIFILLSASFLMLTSCAEPATKLSMADNAAICKKAHDLFSTNKFDDVLNLAADNIQVISNATGQTFNGKEEFRKFLSGFKTAFPDMVLRHTNVFESTDGYVALEFEADATHTGPLEGPGGTIPATGKKIKLTVCEIMQVVNGKIAFIHNYQDSGSLMRQLGLMPPPPSESSTK